jgi:hypothetical protein
MDDVMWVVVLVAVNGLVLFVYLGERRAERRRTEQLAHVADQLGFEFSADGDARLLDLQHPLFLLGDTKKLWNLMQGKRHGLHVAIFDYEYVTGRGRRDRARYRYSVVRFAFEGPCLPSFALHPRPRRVLYDTVSTFGYKDISFEGLPLLFRLRGFYDDEESASRRLFAALFIKFYEEKGDLSTECSGNVLLVYRESRVDPQALSSFMEEGVKVFSAYRKVE